MTIKIGDRVRVTKNYYGNGPDTAHLAAGVQGVVGKIVDGGFNVNTGRTTQIVCVHLDNEEETMFNDGGWAYPADYVEPV